MLDEIYRGVRFCGFLQLLHFASRTVQMEGLVSLQLFLSEEFPEAKTNLPARLQEEFTWPRKACPLLPQPAYHLSPGHAPGLCASAGCVALLRDCWISSAPGCHGGCISGAGYSWQCDGPVRTRTNRTAWRLFCFFFFACFLNLLRKLTDLPFTGNLWLSAVFVRGSVLQDGLHTSLLPVYLKENTISLEAIRTQKMWNTV